MLSTPPQPPLQCDVFVHKAWGFPPFLLHKTHNNIHFKQYSSIIHTDKNACIESRRVPILGMFDQALSGTKSSAACRIPTHAITCTVQGEILFAIPHNLMHNRT